MNRTKFFKKNIAIKMVALLIVMLSYISCFSLLLHSVPVYANSSVFEILDVDLNGASKFDSNYLKTDCYVTNLDNGFNVQNSTNGSFLSNGQFVSFYIDTFGENGEVYLDNDKYYGYDAYGFISGTGEKYTEIVKDKDNKNKEVEKLKLVGIKLKYNYPSNNNLIGADGKIWDICNDSWKGTINGLSSVGVVGHGALIVQKFVPTEEKKFPVDNSDWKRLNEFSGKETDGLHTVDFFNEYNPSTKNSFTVYTPSGSDLQKGIFVKITVAYELIHTEKVRKKDVNTYKNIIEETTFYLCNTSAEVVFQNLYSETAEGGNISNNQGVQDSFRVDINGWNYDVSYKFNDSDNFNNCEDGQVFIDTGKYEFYIKTKIGIVRHKTIYVHEKSNDANLNVYFGNSIFSDDSIRVFAPDENYPVYVKGNTTIKTIDENISSTKHAPLVGRVYLLKDKNTLLDKDNWEEVTRDEKGLPIDCILQTEKLATEHNWSFSNLSAGKYEVIFANNEDYFKGNETGDTYKFVWRFTIVEEGITPFVNKELFYQQIGFSDFESEHYVVKLPSKGIGNVLVYFKDYNEAYYYAEKYLASTVKLNNNMYSFNNKTYETEKLMLNDLYTEAENIIVKHYFDATDVYTYLSLNKKAVEPYIDETSTEEEIEYHNSFVSILNMNLQYDVVVFIDENSASNNAIGIPFLNDRVYAYIDENGLIQTERSMIQFISVADFESSRIILQLEGTDILFEIPYKMPIQAYLESKNAPSGLYKIIESNPCGNTEYYGVYIKPYENTTSIEIERLYNINNSSLVLTQQNSGKHYKCNNFKIKNITNELDPYGIIKIEKDDQFVYIRQIDDIDDLPYFDTEGTYSLTVVDRLGNSFTIYIDIYTAEKIYEVKFFNQNGFRTEKAYVGKEFILERLDSLNNKLEFYCWIDQDGNEYKDVYVFNKPIDVELRPVYHYTSVKIMVFDGSAIQLEERKVGEVFPLNDLIKENYELFGYEYKLSDGSKLIYRGQITSIPNVSEMRLDAIWTKTEENIFIERGENNDIKLSLVDGNIKDVLNVSKEGIINLPQLEDTTEMSFVGWLYEYRLNGIIFTNEFSYNDILEIGFSDRNALKLTAIWKSKQTSNTSTLSTIIAGTTISPINSILNNIKNSLAQLNMLYVGISMLAVSLMLLLVVNLQNIKIFVLNICKSLKNKFNNNDIEKQRYTNSFIGQRNSKSHFAKNRNSFAVAFVSAILCLSMLFSGLYTAISFTKDKVVLAIEQYQQEQAEQEKEETKVDIKYTLLNSDASLNDTDLEITYDLNCVQEFLKANIVLDLTQMGYEDVFTAKAITGINTPNTSDDRTIDGIGYTAYVDAYEENGGYIFGAGFVSFIEDGFITDEDINNGVKIVINEDEADYYDYKEFKLNTNKTWGPLHYVAYEKYVCYQVQDYTIISTITDDNGTYIDAYGDVYNFDIDDYCHFVNYDTEFKLDAFGLSNDVDYNTVLQTYLELIQEQQKNSINITVEHADFISFQALQDYATIRQDEKFLNVNPSELLWYEANIAQNQYYIIRGDGTVEVLTLPQDPQKKASIWERIYRGALAVGGAIAGVVVCAIPGVGPILGGAIVSASIDLFTQVAINGTNPKDINWTSVLTSAIIGGVTGGIGQVGSALTKPALKAAKGTVKKLLIKLGTQVVSGMVGGSATYLISSAIKGEKPDFAECMKSVALGAVTGAITCLGGAAIEKITNNASNWMVSLQIISGSILGAGSYALACLINGQEFTWQGFALSAAMGAATATIMVIGGKIVKTIQEKQEIKSRIKDNLPADDNKTWSIVDKNGNKVTKAELLKHPYKKVYITGEKNGVSYKFPVKKGYVQFDDATIAKVKFKDGFGPSSYKGNKISRDKYNMKVFDELAAEEWNRQLPKDLPNDLKSSIEQMNRPLTRTDISKIRAEYGYTWHECEDTFTAQLVPTDIHESISHAGGVSVVNNMDIIAKKQRLKSMTDFLISRNIFVENIT